VLYLNGRELKPLQHPAEAIRSGIGAGAGGPETAGLFPGAVGVPKSDPPSPQAARVLAVFVNERRERRAGRATYRQALGIKMAHPQVAIERFPAAISKRFCWRAAGARA